MASISTSQWASVVGMLAMAAMLWFFPLWIAHRFVPRTQFDNHVSLQPLEAARVGCALIGLWFFAKSALSLAWFALMFILQNSGDSAFQQMSADDKVTFVYTLIELVFSLALMLRAATFAKLVVREAKAPAP